MGTTTTTRSDGRIDNDAPGRGRALARRSRRALGTALVASCLVLGAGAGTAVADDQPAGGNVSGTVNDASGAPITSGDVCVTSYREGQGWFGPDPVRTDDHGRWSMTGLQAGRYTFSVADCDDSERDDVPGSYGDPDTDRQTTVDVGDGTTTGGLDVRLRAGTRISGRVFGGDGEDTIVKACVQAQPQDGGSQAFAQTIQVDDDGRYVLRHVPVGERYTVGFSLCLFASPSTNFAPVYYGGGLDPDEAATVEPTVDRPAENVDGHMPVGARLTGTVRDSAGDPITDRGACIAAEPTTKFPLAVFSFGQMNDDGTYVLAALPAGTYRVSFRRCNQTFETGDDALSYYGGDTEADATLVTVGAGETKTDIDGRLARGTSISGTVTSDLPDDEYGQAATSRTCVTATPHGAATKPRPADQPAPYPYRVGPDGAYAIHGLPVLAEGYDVHLGVDCGISWPGDGGTGFAPTYHGGDFTPESAQAVRPTADAPATGVDAHLDAGGTIAGAVTASDGTRASTSVCVTATRARTGDDARAFVSAPATVRADGTYAVPDLPAGAYDVRAASCTPGDDGADLPTTHQGSVDVSAGATSTDADIAMRAGTTISGRVFAGADTDHRVGSACVDAFAADAAAGDDPVASTTTNGRGAYVLGHLSPGDALRVRFAPCDGGPRGYRAQWFDGVAKRADATVLRPTADAPVTDADAHLVDDVPDVRITSGPADGSTTSDTDARFTFAAADGEAARFTCSVDGATAASCTSPASTGTLAAGEHTFTVSARRGRNVDPSPATVTWTVDPASDTSTSKGHVEAGDTFDPDGGRAPSPASPTVAVTMPVAADVALTKEPATTAAPSGYTVSGRQLALEATGDDGKRAEGTAAKPIAVSFAFASLPEGSDPATFTMLRDGVALRDCTGDGTAASPDPCVAKRTPLADGGLELRVLTTHLSTWNLAQAKKTTPPPTGGGGGTPTPTTTTPAPTTTPTPATTGTTVVPAPSTTSTTTAPPSTTPAPAAAVHRAAFATARTPRLRKALASGLLVRLRCTGGCGATVRVTVAGAVARRLRLTKAARRTTVARGSRAITADGTYVRVRFTRKARKALARLRRVSVTVQATPTGAGAGPAVTRRLTLRR